MFNKFLKTYAEVLINISLVKRRFLIASYKRVQVAITLKKICKLTAHIEIKNVQH